MAKEQNTEFLSPQLSRYNNGKRILELNGQFNPASVHNAYKLHAGTDELIEGVPIKSGVSVAIVDYTTKPVNTVKAFLKSEDVEWLWDFVQKEKWGEAIGLVKVHLFKKGKDGKCPIQSVQFIREEKDENANPYKLHWKVTVGEGRAVPNESESGKISYNKSTYEKGKLAFLRLSDRDMFNLINGAVKAMHIWEIAYGVPLLEEQDELRRINRLERMERCG